MAKRMTLRSKIILILIVFGLLPILAYFLILFHNYTNVLRERTDRLTEYAMAQTANNIGHQIETARSMVISVLLGPELPALLSQYSRSSSEDNISLKYQIQIALSALIANESRIDSLVFIREDLDHVVYYKRYQTHASESAWNNRALRERLMDCVGYKDMPRRLSDLYVFTSNSFPEDASLSSPSLYFAFPIYDMVSRSDYGLLVVEMPSTVFESVIALEDSEAGLNMMSQTHSYIVNEQNTVIHAMDSHLLGRSLEELPEHADPTFSSRAYPIEGTTLTLHSYFNSTALQREVDRFQRIMLPFPLAMSVLLIVLIFIISKRYTSNIRLVATGLRRFSDGQDVVIDINPADEMFVIVEQFNRMQRRIRSLLDELREKNIRIRESTDRRRKAEIQALQAQINPHFLYNTLDSINWMAIASKQNNISAAISTLASLLRYSISNIDTIVTLEAEILWLEKYTFLQAMRFPGTFHLHLDLEDENRVKGFPVHKMLLQPIVENAIQHGLDRSSEREQFILLHARIKVDGRLMLTLSDNGAGMDDSTMAGVIRQLDSPQPGEGDGEIGLRNVQDRMRLYYGDQASFTIESKAGVGTKITYLIPATEHDP